MMYYSDVEDSIMEREYHNHNQNNAATYVVSATCLESMHDQPTPTHLPNQPPHLTSKHYLLPWLVSLFAVLIVFLSIWMVGFFYSLDLLDAYVPEERVKRTTLFVHVKQRSNRHESL